jgi:SlyX protein
MSNTGMDIPEPIERRLVELEIKAAYSEDLHEQLSAQIYRQQQQIDLLLQELRLLRERWPEGASAAPRSLRDERPPHY